MLEEYGIWRELAQWRRSGAQYASAIQLWGRAAAQAQEPPWPPSNATLDAYGFFFRNGESFARYVSHVRAVLRMLKAPLGALSETTGVVSGSKKLTPASARRVKRRATAEQTRRLAAATREELGRPDVADAFIVPRHFCLRFGAEVVLLERRGRHSAVDVSTCTDGGGSRPEVSLTFYDRKMASEVVPVVRRCICALQGRRLCGVCTLTARLTAEVERIFPDVTYTEGLAFRKLATDLVGPPEPATSGTHCFRRGWADEALQAGGPTALFYSGGWRGVAAFGYTAAKTRGAMASAEWLIDFSDSDPDE